MTIQILTSKIYIPPPRLRIVTRPRLVEQIKKGISAGCRLTLISAAAGFGKTTLVSEWAAACLQPKQKIAWYSVSESDNDLSQFLTYLIAAIQTIKPGIGNDILGVLQAPQLPPVESMLIGLINELAAINEEIVLVLDDYHVIDSTPVDEALTFFLNHLPPRMHVIIATREDPDLPLARMRARGLLTELRASELRFTVSEAVDFFQQVMDLTLSPEDILAIENRTEGWIAGLQLAALALSSMPDQQDTADFLKSFTGSHHFVLDYLIEEVLQKQPKHIQNFLLRTSILERMCGPLCDAVIASAATSGQETLELLERANLFIVPLDSDRCWYRYHHLFRDLLRQHFYSRFSQGKEDISLGDYHVRASQWFENNDLPMESFQHAIAANDIERATRLMESRKIPLHDRFAVTTILNWLSSLPIEVMDANPLLWLRYGSMALVNVQTSDVERRLQAAEAALSASLKGGQPDENARTMIGQIAAARATLILLTQYHPEGILIQAQRAMEYLPPDNLESRFTAVWARGVAYQILGNRSAALQSHSEALSICQKTGNTFHTVCVLNSLGQVQESENQLLSAVESYKSVLTIFGDYPQPNVGEALLGLARIYYQWNELDFAEQYAQKSLTMAKRYDRKIDRYLLSEVFIARLKMIRGDVDGAAEILAESERSIRQNNFLNRSPDVIAAQIQVLIRQGNLSAAELLTQANDLPISQARVLLAQGHASAALAVLAPVRQMFQEKKWIDEELKVMVLQTIALQANNKINEALALLSEALTIAEPGGYIRIFIEEGSPMAQLLTSAASLGIKVNYCQKLLENYSKEPQQLSSDWQVDSEQIRNKTAQISDHLVEPLSQRELEILQLISKGLSNQEISERLFLALSTIKGHNRNIFNKLHVQNRTEAVAYARELGLL